MSTPKHGKVHPESTVLQILTDFHVHAAENVCLVFSRRFSREKSPTLTVASFFLFFSSDYNLTLIGPLFLQSELLKLLA